MHGCVTGDWQGARYRTGVSKLWEARGWSCGCHRYLPGGERPAQPLAGVPRPPPAAPPGPARPGPALPGRTAAFGRGWAALGAPSSAPPLPAPAPIAHGRRRGPCPFCLAQGAVSAERGAGPGGPGCREGARVSAWAEPGGGGGRAGGQPAGSLRGAWGQPAGRSGLAQCGAGRAPAPGSGPCSPAGPGASASGPRSSSGRCEQS